LVHRQRALLGVELLDFTEGHGVGAKGEGGRDRVLPALALGRFGPGDGALGVLDPAGEQGGPGGGGGLLVGFGAHGCVVDTGAKKTPGPWWACPGAGGGRPRSYGGDGAASVSTGWDLEIDPLSISTSV